MSDTEINLNRKSFTVNNPDNLEEVPILQRIELPLIWARLTCGVRIVELQEDHYSEALNLLREYFIKEEVLCKASNMSDDEESVKAFIDTARYWIKDSTSMIAVLEGSGTVIGVLVNRVVNKLDHTRTMSRIQPVRCGQLMQGEAFNKVMSMRCEMHKMCDVFEKYDVEEFFRFYAICVKPQHRGKGVGMGLLNSGIKLAKLMREPVAMGIFTSARSQSLAFKLGMEVLLEINYADWLKDDEVVFEDPGAGNYSAILMAMKL